MMTQPLPYGPIMIDIEGMTLTQRDREKIAHPNTGALILFSRNFQSAEQIEALIDEIRLSRNGEILIAVDQEGGRVQRFRQGFTRLPAAKTYAVQPELAEPAGWLMATELLSVGVDFSFAPVLDVDCGISAVIGDRSFSNDYRLAAALAEQFRKGMRSAGMAATGKHFPGHGAVAADSHLDLPVDSRSLQDIWAKDIQPFAQLIAQGLEAIMPAHVLYPAIDELPAGFSKRWLQDILRQQLNFQGAIFSDDLSMEGAAFAGDFVDRAKMAQAAGCDMLLVCNNPAAAEQVLEQLPIVHDPLRQSRLAKMRGKVLLGRDQLLNSEKWRQTASQLAALCESQGTNN